MVRSKLFLFLFLAVIAILFCGIATADVYVFDSINVGEFTSSGSVNMGDRIGWQVMFKNDSAVVSMFLDDLTAQEAVTHIAYIHNSSGDMIANATFSYDNATFNPVVNVSKDEIYYLSTACIDDQYNFYYLEGISETVNDTYNALTQNIIFLNTTFNEVINNAWSWSPTNFSMIIYDGLASSSPLYPNVTSFDGSSTNFSSFNQTQLDSLSGVVLEKSAFGRVSWNVPVNVSGADFDSFMDVGQAFAFLDSASLPNMNASANISLYNISFVNPLILKDGAVCLDCVELSYVGNTYNFSVTGFSNYSLNETPNNLSVYWNASSFINGLVFNVQSPPALNLTVVGFDVFGSNLQYLTVCRNISWHGLVNCSILPVASNGDSLLIENFGVIVGSYPFDGFGNITYWASVNDSFGNMNFSESRIIVVVNITLDNTSPSISFISPSVENGSLLDVNYFDVTVQASDANLRNVSIFVFDGSDLVYNFTTNSSIAYSRVTVGRNSVYRIYGQACDTFGNCNSTSSRYVTVYYGMEGAGLPSVTGGTTFALPAQEVLPSNVSTEAIPPTTAPPKLLAFLHDDTGRLNIAKMVVVGLITLLAVFVVSLILVSVFSKH